MEGERKSYYKEKFNFYFSHSQLKQKIGKNHLPPSYQIQWLPMTDKLHQPCDQVCKLHPLISLAVLSMEKNP